MEAHLNEESTWSLTRTLLAAVLTPHLLHHRLGELQPVLKGKRRSLKQPCNKDLE